MLRRRTYTFRSSQMTKRISRAREEIQVAGELPWDLFLVNSDFDKAAADLIAQVGRWFGLPLEKGK